MMSLYTVALANKKRSYSVICSFFQFLAISLAVGTDLSIPLLDEQGNKVSEVDHMVEKTIEDDHQTASSDVESLDSGAEESEVTIL